MNDGKESIIVETICRKLDQLKTNEKENLRFTLQVKDSLLRELPEASTMPLIYIGSGGDIVTALLVSGSKRIILVDNNPFLAKNKQEGFNDDLFQSVEDVLAVVDSNKARLGLLKYARTVQPAVDIIAELEKVGINRESITISTNGIDGQLRIALSGQEIVIEFISANVQTADNLKAILQKANIESKYGVLVRGGVEYEFQHIIEVSDSGVCPHPDYFVSDDPRSIDSMTLLYPGYSAHEVLSTTAKKWGYSMPDDKGHTARAVVGILESSKQRIGTN